MARVLVFFDKSEVYVLVPNFKRILAVAVLSGMTTFAFAEDAAPVYDADNYPPQFDGQSDIGNGAQSQSQSQAQTYAAPPTQSLSLDQRVARTEHQITNLQHSDASSKTEALQNEIQSLRGQVESLTHQIQQMQLQQRTQYSDLDKRLNSSKVKPVEPITSTTSASVEEETSEGLKTIPDETIAPKAPVTKPAVKPAKPAKVAQTTETPAVPIAKSDVQQPNVAEEQQIYQTAYNLIKAKKYNEAVAALQKMLQKYPSGQFAANAHYWLGELYGLMGNSGQSAVEFSNIVKNYPDSPKVSDAQLKLGLIYAAAFKWRDAKSAFKKVINHYPGTASARLASEQLKQIKEAGH